MGRILTVGATALVTALVWAGWHSAGTPGVSRIEPAPATPAESRQREILKASVGKPGDPELMSQYAAINTRHFGGGLPPVVVRWEPALADIGPLTGDDFTLQGMFGRAESASIILLNPVVKNDAAARDRALCHEIVHAFLSTAGDEDSSHGPVFQAVLERLAREGAFEGIVADAGEKARLRAWLDAESAAIDAERQAMDALDAQIRQVGADLDREISAFNARADRPETEAQQLEARRQAYNQQILAANERVERDRAQLAFFNREVARYNLMMAYPDGLDEASRVEAKKGR